MRSSTILVVLLAVLAVACFGVGLWLFGENAARAGAVSDGEISQADRGADGEAEAGDARNGSADGEGGVDARRRDVDAGASAWAIAGVTKLGKAAAPGIALRVELHKGYEWQKAPTVKLVETDEEGRFLCAFPCPRETQRFRISSANEDVRISTESVLVVRGKEPPKDLVLNCYPFDCDVALRVVDENDKAVAGAWIVTGNKRELARSDARGRATFRASSVSKSINLQVGAPGFAVRRHKVAGLRAGETSEARVTLLRSVTIRGVVRDERGTPVAGARVENFMSCFFRHTESDGNGRFVLDWLAPGRASYSVYARKDGYLEGRSNVSSAQFGDEIELVLMRGIRVSGRVTDPDGRPVPAASLYIGFSPSAYNRIDARANDEGRFDFPVVAPGEQRLSCEAEGFAPSVRKIQVPKDEIGILLDIGLDRGNTLTGRLLDADGEGVEGLYLSTLTHPKSGQRGEYLSRRTRSDAEGRFRIEHLPGGLVQVEVYGGSYRRHLEKGVPSDKTDLEIRLQQSAKLAGRVVDALTGAPIRKFRIRLGSTAGLSATWVRQGMVFDDPKGEWTSRSERLEKGKSFAVEAWADGYAHARVTGVVARLEPSADDCVIRLARGGEVSGTVLSKTTGRAIEGARVTVSLEHAPYHAGAYTTAFGKIQSVTDANGAFRLRDIPAGSIELVVEHASFQALRDGPLDVRPGAKIVRTLQPAAASKIRGRFLDASGAGLRGSVSAHPIPHRRGRRPAAFASSDGSFALGSVPEGEWVVHGFVADEAGAARMAFERLRVEEGKSQRVELKVRAGAPCELRMKDARAGKRAPKAIAVLQGISPARITLVLQAPLRDGAYAFRVEGLMPGKWRFHANGVGENAPHVDFTWPRRAQTPLVLELR